MEEITQAEQDRLLKVMRKHRKRLKAFPNVRSVDLGMSSAPATDRALAIRVHVDAKQPEWRWRRRSGCRRSSTASLST